MNKSKWISYIAVLIFGGLWIGFKYMEYRLLTLFTLNYAVFEESAYNLLKHGSMFNYPEFFLHGAPSHMAIHFEPSIVLYSIGLALTGKPWIMAVMDAMSWTIAGLLVVHFAIKENKNPLPYAMLWIFNPITNTIFYDAEPVNLGLPIMILSLYYGMKRDWKKFAIWTTALFFIKEDAGLLIIALGILFMNDYIIEFFENGLAAIKDFFHSDVLGLKISLIGVFMILASEGFIYLRYGNGWVEKIYFGNSSVLFTWQGMVFLLLDLILFGLPFIKKQNAGYFVGLVVLMSENFLSTRQTQMVYYYYYYAYVAAFVMVFLIFQEIDWKKYLSAVIIIFLFFSPFTGLITQTPLKQKMWYGQLFMPVVNAYADYPYVYKTFDDEADKSDLLIQEAIQKDGHVCVGSRLYPRFLLKYYGKIYPMMVCWSGWEKVYPVCNEAIVFYDDSSCPYAVAKKVVSVV